MYPESEGLTWLRVTCNLEGWRDMHSGRLERESEICWKLCRWKGWNAYIASHKSLDVKWGEVSRSTVKSGKTGREEGRIGWDSAGSHSAVGAAPERRCPRKHQTSACTTFDHWFTQQLSDRVWGRGALTWVPSRKDHSHSRTKAAWERWVPNRPAVGQVWAP